MSSGYTQFTNEMEGGQMGAPPVYNTQDPGVNQTNQAGYPAQIQTFPQQPVPCTYVYGQAPVQQTITHISVPPVNDYLGFAIFVTFCCCLPLGIVAIIRSIDVRSRAAAGDFAGAKLASDDAKRYSWIGCIIGGSSLAITGIVLGVLFGIGAASGATLSNYDY